MKKRLYNRAVILKCQLYNKYLLAPGAAVNTLPEILNLDSPILSLDASHQELSVALWSKARGTIAEHITNDGRLALSALLLPAIDGVLNKAQLVLPDVGLFAATCGPGSFTGLRTGLATIKALAEACARKVVAVPTLHAVALCEARVGEMVVAMIPAGRSEVFVQLLRIKDDSQVEELSEPAHTPPQIAIDKFCKQTHLIWAGSASRLYKELIEARAVDSRIGAVPSVTLAACVARIGYRKGQDGEAVSPARVGAFYVRPSVAELSLRENVKS